MRSSRNENWERTSSWNRKSLRSCRHFMLRLLPEPWGRRLQLLQRTNQKGKSLQARLCKTQHRNFANHQKRKKPVCIATTQWRARKTRHVWLWRMKGGNYKPQERHNAMWRDVKKFQLQQQRATAIKTHEKTACKTNSALMTPSKHIPQHKGHQIFIPSSGAMLKANI